MVSDSTHLDIKVDVHTLKQAAPWLAQLTAFLADVVGPKVAQAQGMFGDKNVNAKVYGTTPGALALTGKVDGLLSGLHSTLGQAVKDLDKIVDATGRIAAKYDSVEDLNATAVNDAFAHASVDAGAKVVDQAVPQVHTDPPPAVPIPTNKPSLGF
jgi:hypothetical protein